MEKPSINRKSSQPPCLEKGTTHGEILEKKHCDSGVWWIEDWPYNDTLPLPNIGTLQVPINEPFSNVRLFRHEFEQKKAIFAIKIA